MAGASAAVAALGVALSAASRGGDESSGRQFAAMCAQLACGEAAARTELLTSGIVDLLTR